MVGRSQAARGFIREEQVALGNAPRPLQCQSQAGSVAWKPSVPGRRRRNTASAEVDRARLSVVEDEHAESRTATTGRRSRAASGTMPATSTIKAAPAINRLTPTDVGLGDDLAEVVRQVGSKPCSCFPGRHGLPRRKVRIRRTMEENEGLRTAAVLVTSGLLARGCGKRWTPTSALFLVVLPRPRAAEADMPFLIMSCGCRLVKSRVRLRESPQVLEPP